MSPLWEMRLPYTLGEAPLGPGGAKTWRRSELRSSCTGSWPSLDSNYLGHMVCMHVCVCVCVCVCVSLYVSARLHVSIYEFVCFRMCLCVHTHILSFLCASVYLFNFAQAALMLSTEKSPSQPTHETASLPSRNILCSRQGLVLNVSGILRIQRSP